MTTNLECKWGGALSAMALAAMLVTAGAGSTAAVAQTSAFQAPASAQRVAPRTGLNVGNTPSSSLAAPVAAPLAAPLGQTGITPANGMANVRGAIPVAGAKKYVLKAQVVQGATLNATQKVAVASAALAELLKQAKEQQDNAKQQTLSQMQSNVSLASGPTLSLLSPRSPTWAASLHLLSPGVVNFVGDRLTFEKSHPGLATCVFTAPEDGYYMAFFTIVNESAEPVKLTASMLLNSLGDDGSNQAIAIVHKGENTVTIVDQASKGSMIRATLNNSGTYVFQSCEISRIK
nr:hypothetical protein [Rhodoferax sp.]